MNSIKVSIVIPTYNRKESLNNTLISLFNQTCSQDKYEIIVCDDGSTDGTEEMVNDLIKKSPCALRYFKEENKGPASARNLGISNALGEIIGFTDDDCVVSKTWIEYAVPHLNNKKIGGVIGATIPEETYTQKTLKTTHTLQITEEEASYATCNIFYSKNVLIEVGGFDAEFKMALSEDTDLGLRVKNRNYEFCFDNTIIVYHNVTYRSIIQHLKSLKKYESRVLLHKKHPELKKFLGFIHNKKHIYPIFTFIYVVFYPFNYSYILLLFAISTYLWAHVFIDWKIKMYPYRIVLFIKHLVPDTIRLYYAIRGSIRYRYILI
jgi:glycosyltransferase involved in cell wall biosynthesis